MFMIISFVAIIVDKTMFKMWCVRVFTVCFLTQVVTRGEYSRASDVYALGCTGIEMLTGEPPWSGLQPHKAFYQVNNAMGVLFSISQFLGLDGECQNCIPIIYPLMLLTYIIINCVSLS